MELDGGDAHSRENRTPQKWRLDRFRERLGKLCPDNLQPADMTFKNYGKSVLRALDLAVDREMLSFTDRKIVWSLATHYDDGQPMATATLVVCRPADSLVGKLVNEWEYCSTPACPLRLDMPALSTLERLTMEASGDARARLGFKLPRSDMGEDPFESFKTVLSSLPAFCACRALG